ncbi:hypothetical protein GJ699_03570 [Duganella sp. FT80W]|uniref:Uncharacterized protein n=1 Tax=Duganella guangzhouensis TaxID=2666084 RepID=A0A6I2KXY2_9BURK|nr:hypothetical protein [Duganella guangzhouensis]MRW89056.1 hypothetical protein [Duganella guangzhouensis]
MKRPTSISVIAWFLIVTSVIALPFQHRSLSDPIAYELLSRSVLPVSVQIALAYAGLAMSLACGIGMLKGFDWSRKVYVGWSVFGLLIGLFTSPMKLVLIPGALILALFAYFLFRPQANAWFVPQKVAVDA